MRVIRNEEWGYVVAKQKPSIEKLDMKPNVMLDNYS